jgi:cyclopropane fatty-acyl-phospholipid synthase-like methyltransferase
LHFWKKNVIDAGSLDINGNNKYLFCKCNYAGVDIVAGKNVDFVGYAHSVIPNIAKEWDRKKGVVDVIISTEMLEHDQNWADSLTAMYESLNEGGLLLITCAGNGRKEHGTLNNTPSDSPGTTSYYKNISNEMFASVLRADMFDEYYLRQYNTDLQFYGIKKWK